MTLFSLLGQQGTAKTKKKTKASQTYHDLCKQIRALRTARVEEKIRIENILEVYNTDIEPVLKKMSDSQVKFAACLTLGRTAFKGLDRQYSYWRTLIFQFHCAAAKLDNDYSDVRSMYQYYAEHLHHGTKMGTVMKNTLVKAMRDCCGVAIRSKDYPDTNEGWAKFNKRMQDELLNVKKFFWVQGTGQWQKAGIAAGSGTRRRGHLGRNGTRGLRTAGDSLKGKYPF